MAEANVCARAAVGRTPAGTRVLVIGASGLIGNALVAEAEQRGARVVGVARQVRARATLELDAGDRAALETLVDRFQPEVIALAAAWSHVDGCERDPERSWRENVGTAETLLAATAGSTTRLVFLSSDYVFDGRAAGPYTERDATSPLNVYGRHKCAAEARILGRTGALVVRTSWVHGEDPGRKCFVDQVRRVARAGGPFVVTSAAGRRTAPDPADEGPVGCPTPADWLADRTFACLDSGVDGIVHLAGPRVVTRVAWAHELAPELNVVVRPPPPDAAPRPERVVLRSERLSG